MIVIRIFWANFWDGFICGFVGTAIWLAVAG